MVAVPAVTPVTVPVVLTVAMALLELFQVPPVVASARVMLAPAHTDDGPVMGLIPAEEITVMALVAVARPQALLTT